MLFNVIPCHLEETQLSCILISL